MLTIYVLDGEAENPVRMEDEAITLDIAAEDGATFAVTLDAVANALTGETVGDSSQFQGTAPELETMEHFDITIPTITVRGVASAEMEIHFPDHEE